MSSINANQPECNHDDIQGQRAVDKIRSLITTGQNCFFCTSLATGITGGVRPMNVREVDERGTLWFLSARDSHQNEEIHTDPTVRLYFQGSKHSDFIYLNGQAEVKDDKVKIADLWEASLKTWFTEGIEDPRITVIRFTPTDGYYWDTKHGSAVAYVKMLVGAAVGKTLDDSIEGRVKV